MQDALLTLENILQWMQEKEIIEARMRVDAARLEELNSKLAAGFLFLSPEQKKQLDAARTGTGPAESQEDDPTNMRAAIRRLAASARDGISYKAFGQALRKEPEFDARLRRSPQVLYSTVYKLFERGELVKRGRVFFTPENLQAWLARQPAPGSNVSPFRPATAGR